MGVETQEGHQSHIDMYDRNPEKKKKKKKHPMRTKAE